MKSKKTLTSTYPWVLIAGGAIGLLSAFVLAVEKIALIKDPSFQPSCDISPLLSCGSVMSTPQAEAFGFANPLIGIGGFAIVLTVGMALAAGASFKRWFWLGLQLGTIFGVAFVHWLFFQSVYNIGALCPYCMVVWAVTIPIFWYTTLYNLKMSYLATPKKLKRIVAFAQRHHGDILLAWFLTIAGLILVRFWYYWQTLL